MPGLGQQPAVEGGERLDVPHVVKQRAIRGTILLDEGHRRGGRAHAGHGDTSFGRPYPAHGVPQMTDEGVSNYLRTFCGAVDCGKERRQASRGAMVRSRKVRPDWNAMETIWTIAYES